MTEDQAAFCARLRREREQRRIAMAAIAKSTKITLSLLVGLERGDVTKWPSGIFRRSFIREYALAVGLPPDECVADFIRLFPEPGDRVRAARQEVTRSCADLRISFAEHSRRPVAPLLFRTTAALADLAVIFTAGALLAALGAADFLTASGSIAVLYYFAATVVMGKTPGLRLLSVFAVSSGLATREHALRTLSSARSWVSRLRHDFTAPKYSPKAAASPKPVFTLVELEDAEGALHSGRTVRSTDGLIDHLPEFRGVQARDLAPER